MSRRAEVAAEINTQLKREARNIGLEIYTQKTKILTQARTRGNKNYLRAVEDNVDALQSFTYLGVELNTRGSEESEIQHRIISANKAYFALSHIFRSKIIHRKSKIWIYKTIIRPILCYGCETWVMTKNSQNKLEVFERRILRRIFEQLNENEIWRRRYNHEIYQLFEEAPISEFVRLQRPRSKNAG